MLAGDESVSRQPLAVEDDLMQLARFGEIAAIEKLFDSGKYNANYKDEQGVTPLHWAASKNHFALCKFLLTAGADVNAQGGDVHATPVLWAARNCNYYIVDLLLQHGADPLLTDDQGFNLIQNATMDGNVFQLSLLLNRDLAVDTPDTKGHTSLMWAAYKGYPACVELLLQWDANVAAKDDQGFTALHWALVKGSQVCIQKLIEYGSDRNATTNEGKTPTTVAKEMQSIRQWHRALAACGYNPDGSQKPFPFAFITKDRRLFISRYFFLYPFVLIGCSIYLLAGLPIFISIPFALLNLFGTGAASKQLLAWAPQNMKHLHHTPYMAGVFAGTLFWVGVQYLRKVLPATYSAAPFLNLLFIASYALCTYFYFIAMLEDPGYVPKPHGRTDQRAVVQDLIDNGIFDESRYCITCMVRKPLRSKHCRQCGRCVAKTDHHCPWINNCVAVNNHRHFLFYLLSMECGIISYVYIIFWTYIEVIPKSGLTDCTLLKDTYCEVLNRDSFTIVLTIWAGLQLTWVTLLICTQLWQISRATTTYEQMRGHQQLSAPAEFVTAAITAGTSNLEDANLTDRGSGPSAGQPLTRRRDGNWERWKKLLGLDIFLATAMYGSRAAEMQTRRRNNHFTRGCATNVKDFFCESAPIFTHKENGMAMVGGQMVDYTKMYEPPKRTDMRIGYEAVATAEEMA